MRSEVILNNKLCRVLLKFDTPLVKYPKFGVWCYLVKTDRGIVVFDPGPIYDTLGPFFRKLFKRTGNVKRILNALDKYYPGEIVTEIICSHYHYDHSEAAPALQYWIYKKHGNIPKIRLHSKDMEKKRFLKVFPDSINGVFSRAGYNRWFIGNPFEHGDKIEGSDFEVMHTPGHTEGTMALVNHKEKIKICGYLTTRLNPFFRFAMMFVDEYPKGLKKSTKRVNDLHDYREFYYHPVY